MLQIEEKIYRQLELILGKEGCITESSRIQPYTEEQRGLYKGSTELVVLPKTTNQVSEIVKICNSEQISIVPIGGNTGLCGGAVSNKYNKEIILSMEKMNKIRELDSDNFTITAESGCILKNIQTTAKNKNLLFPLSLASEGSCQIGGNLSTNAGGINVIRYGSARDLVLGLEVVLSDGKIWNGLRSLHKDNMGYSIKNFFLGSEGTLGIITAAVLKLFPEPKKLETIFCALESLDHITDFIHYIKLNASENIAALELLPRIGIEFCKKHFDNISSPLAGDYEWYLLIEFSSSSPNIKLLNDSEKLINKALQKGLIADAVIAKNIKQSKHLWYIRELFSEAQKREGASIKHDVSVPTSKLPEFINLSMKAIKNSFPAARPCPFGHVGDGNIHFNISQPINEDRNKFLESSKEISNIIHEITIKLGGSVSAEHGIGLLKVEELENYRDLVEVDLMRRIKTTLDPKNIMNPGKVIKKI